MTCGAIIFSRMDSARLPGKALKDISGKSLLGHVIDRAKCIAGIEKIILATSSRGIDDPIADFGKLQGLDVYRGSVDDVAGRALAACRAFGLSKFARICGDRAFFSPELVSELISIHDNNEVDVVTTMHPRTYPPGLTTEIICVEALDSLISKTDDSADREHVTNYFYRNPEEFNILNVDAPEYLKSIDLRLVVDDELDLARARWIAERVDTVHGDLAKIVRCAKEFDNTLDFSKDSK